MSRSRKPKPFDKIMLTRSKLDLFIEYGDAALQGQQFPDFMRDVRECYGHLLTFRNLVNSMVGLEETPEEAVRAFLPVTEGEGL